jgi:hypothetical protein
MTAKEKYFIYTVYQKQEEEDKKVVREGKYGLDRCGGSVDIYISKTENGVQIPEKVINLEAVVLNSYSGKGDDKFFSEALKLLPLDGYGIILYEGCIIYFFDKNDINYDNIDTYEKMGVDYDDLGGSIEQVYFK